MLEIMLQVASFGGPVTLAVMGFVVVDLPPPSKKARIIWYVAFALVGILTVAAAITESNKQEERMTAMIIGGDNFPELYGLSQPDQNGRLPLQIANTKGTPLFDVTFSIKKAGTFESIAVKNWGTLLNASFDTGIWLEPGNYQIDILARNGWFIEMYTLGTCKGAIFQNFSITMPLNGGS